MKDLPLDRLEGMIDHDAPNTPTGVLTAARELLDRCRKHEKKDRKVLLRMAGNIAAGIAGDENLVLNKDDKEWITDDAVEMAKTIMTKVDA